MAWAFIHFLGPYLDSIYAVVEYIVFPGEEVVGAITKGGTQSQNSRFSFPL